MVIVRCLLALCALLGTQVAAADTAAQLLRANNIPALEALLSTTQQRFESGELSEYDLRNTYRDFYKLDAVSAQNLARWAASAPDSYVAHLAYGVYLKRLGSDARGGDYIQKTPASALDKMAGYYEQASKALVASLPLTRKPYLSVFHLMTISMHYGDHAASLKLLHRANAMLPDNSLVRNRYATTLLPRWGGTYEVYEQFVAHAKTEHVPDRVLWQLEAIEEDDKGHSLVEQNRQLAAMPYFRHALELGSRVGGSFAVDQLDASRFYGCSGKDIPPACR